MINEAVELAKKFSTEDSGRYVNGVLERVRRQVGGAEPPRSASGEPRDRRAAAPCRAGAGASSGGGAGRVVLRHRQVAGGPGAVRAAAVRRRRGRHRRVVLAQPARHQPHGGLPALALDPRLRAQRHAARQPLPREPHLGHHRPHPGARAQRLHRDRGRALLPAPRGRLHRHRARRAGRLPPPAVPGRLDDHAAARPPALPLERGLVSRARSRKRCWRSRSSATTPRTRSSSATST